MSVPGAECVLLGDSTPESEPPPRRELLSVPLNKFDKKPPLGFVRGSLRSKF